MQEQLNPFGIAGFKPVSLPVYHRLCWVKIIDSSEEENLPCHKLVGIHPLKIIYRFICNLI